MTADLLRFALEDARSAAVRVQLASEQTESDERRGELDRVKSYLSAVIWLLECAIAGKPA